MCSSMVEYSSLKRTKRNNVLKIHIDAHMHANLENDLNEHYMSKSVVGTNTTAAGYSLLQYIICLDY